MLDNFPYKACLLYTTNDEETTVRVYKEILTYITELANDIGWDKANYTHIDGGYGYLMGAHFVNKQDYDDFMKLYGEYLSTFEEYKQQERAYWGTQ